MIDLVLGFLLAALVSPWLGMLGWRLGAVYGKCTGKFWTDEYSPDVRARATYR